MIGTGPDPTGPAGPRRRGGTMLVEMALLLPLFLILLFGIMDFGIYLFLQVSANHAVRQAMRLATSNAATRTQIRNEVINDCVGCNLSTANVTITTGGNCPYLYTASANALACKGGANRNATCEPDATWSAMNAANNWNTVNNCAPWVEIQVTLDHGLFLKGFWGYNSLQVQSIMSGTISTWAGQEIVTY